MGNSLSLSIAKCNNDTKLFAGSGGKSSFDLSVGHRHPASIQSQLLCLQNKAFSVITSHLIKGGRFCSDDSKVAGNTAEFSVVSHKTVKSLRLICDQLNMHSAFPVAGRDFLLQFINRFSVYWFLIILTNAVSSIHCFCQIHISDLHFMSFITFFACSSIKYLNHYTIFREKKFIGKENRDD